MTCAHKTVRVVDCLNCRDCARASDCTVGGAPCFRHQAAEMVTGNVAPLFVNRWASPGYAQKSAARAKATAGAYIAFRTYRAPILPYDNYGVVKVLWEHGWLPMQFLQPKSEWTFDGGWT